MGLYPVVALALCIAAFLYLAIRSFIYALRGGPPVNARRLAIAVGGLSVTFLALAAQGLAQQAVRRGWLPTSAQEWMFTVGTSILATFGLVMAGVCFWLIAHFLKRVQQHEKLVTVMITSPLVDVKASELGLTAREFEVLETMAEGKLSDDEIAEAFFISPATAATHVRNILRKADVNNRRDLVLMYSASHGGGTAAG